jgi:hypothetical protein
MHPLWPHLMALLTQVVLCCWCVVGAAASMWPPLRGFRAPPRFGRWPLRELRVCLRPSLRRRRRGMWQRSGPVGLESWWSLMCVRRAQWRWFPTWPCCSLLFTIPGALSCYVVCDYPGESIPWPGTWCRVSPVCVRVVTLLFTFARNSPMPWPVAAPRRRAWRRCILLPEQLLLHDDGARASQCCWCYGRWRWCQRFVEGGTTSGRGHGTGGATDLPLHPPPGNTTTE